MKTPAGWFCALLDASPDVYFRYVFSPARRFVYVSPAVETLTGHQPADFYRDANLCLGLVARADRRRLRQVLRSRRPKALTIQLVRDEVALPVELRTVALVRERRVVAIEGVARLAVGDGVGRPQSPAAGAGDGNQPEQQRLAALMVEVHELLHRVLPPARPEDATSAPRELCCGGLVLDADRLTVTESGREVGLTTREVMLLRYLLQRPGRVLTRERLLTDVWAWHYTGDDRTVDVHVSRLRRKLPSLRGRLVAIRNVGYRLDLDAGEQRTGTD